MKNVTISLDDETHRRARIRAAELGISLSRLVRDLIKDFDTTGKDEIMPSGITRSEHDRLAALEIELRRQVPVDFRAADRLSRDEVHDRRY